VYQSFEIFKVLEALQYKQMTDKHAYWQLKVLPRERVGKQARNGRNIQTMRSRKPQPLSGCHVGNTGETRLYRVVQKIRTLFSYALTLSNIDQFSNLFHCYNQEKIYNNSMYRPITPQVCHYTTCETIASQKQQLKARRLL